MFQSASMVCDSVKSLSQRALNSLKIFQLFGECFQLAKILFCKSRIGFLSARHPVSFSSQSDNRFANSSALLSLGKIEVPQPLFSKSIQLNRQMNQRPGRHLPFSSWAGSLYADAPRAVVVTVVDAFLTVIANQASSIRQRALPH